MTSERSNRSPIDRLIRPFQEFVRIQASGGILLLICAVVALIWSNSPAAETYFHIWETPITIGFGHLTLTEPIHLWINDGLMAIFFFVVGLEIKREFLVGELSTPQQAALPIAGAIGGMVAPALLYASMNAGTPGAPGWGVPMATDIAFAIGMLAVLGKRVPVALKVFLIALAIVDDIGAVLVIALYYTSHISGAALGFAAIVTILLISANLMGVRNQVFYCVLGIFLWAAFLKSGVHAAIAGVLLAMTIPSSRRIDTAEFAARVRSLLDKFTRSEKAAPEKPPRLPAVLSEDQKAAVQALENASEGVQSPMQNLEHMLHPWVTFAIMPLFALANAGISFLEGGIVEATAPVDKGILLGLILGKPIGITFFSWLAVRGRFAAIPAGTTWRQFFGVGLLGGIGFTMSLFIAGLAFPSGALLVLAKKGILIGSLAAGLGGWALLRFSRSPSGAQA
jgi:NhaA family Na+:H+ antiporter